MTCMNNGSTEIVIPFVTFPESQQFNLAMKAISFGLKAVKVYKPNLSEAAMKEFKTLFADKIYDEIFHKTNVQEYENKTFDEIYELCIMKAYSMLTELCEAHLVAYTLEDPHAPAMRHPSNSTRHTGPK